MIRIQQLKFPITHTEDDLYHKLAKMLRISSEQIIEYKIVRRSIDARKKHEISYVYVVDVKLSPKTEVGLSKKIFTNNVAVVQESRYEYPNLGKEDSQNRPVIVGSGPAGLFCAYALGAQGYQPIIIERGKPVEERVKDVQAFWDTGILNSESNVQFGEGGAGTFSDGKLNTLIKDSKGRKQKVVDTLIAFGAPEDIAYESKPHIGTDLLAKVVQNMRKAIIQMGGTFYFETRVEDFVLEGGRIQSITCRKSLFENRKKEECFGSQGNKRTNISSDQNDLPNRFGKKESELNINTDILVLAIGHSARDTFEVLEKRGFSMEAKNFAVGLRVEHPQEMISRSQYGEACKLLPAAPYMLAGRVQGVCGDGNVWERGIYSFCMCPGGYVVNASSEADSLAVNGMSYHSRDGENANSAIILSVDSRDFPESGPLAGVRFQQELEKKVYQMAGGVIPQQLLGDFEKGKMSREYGEFGSQTKGTSAFAPLHELFSPEMTAGFCQGMRLFGKKIPGFDRYDTILSGVESRTSSPVRILRDEDFESSYKGIYPCGEGAGYAGGIMSAAIDGLKVAEKIMEEYTPI